MPSWLERRPWLLPCGLFLVALVVRIIHLMEASAGPTFAAPIIDAARYDAIARRLLRGGDVDAELFWQPSFYPLLLAALYRIFGASLVIVKGLQAVVGALTCVVTYKLGQRVGSRKVGTAAGLALAFYGPALHFEAQLLSTAWATLAAVTFLWLILRAARSPRATGWLLAGVAGGTLVWIRPVFLPAVAAVALTALVATSGIGGELKKRLVAAAVLTLGVLLPLAPVIAVSGTQAGLWSPVPYSSGINLWLGNGPDYCRQLRIRPGVDWRRLVAEPRRLGGAETPAAAQRYFVRKTVKAIRADPAHFAAGLGRKGMRLISGREIPRNVDVYAARRWSGVLGLLSWRLGGFGFPFGLLFPLACLGLWVARRRGGPWIPVFLLVGSLSLVAVFAAGRYRLPLVPALAVLAALGGRQLWRWWREGHRRALVWAGLSLVVAGLLSSLPGPFCEERGPFAAELHLGAGIHHERHGRLDRAQRQYERALRLEPSLFEAHVNLGLLLHRRGEPERALVHHRRAAALRKDAAAPRVGAALVHLDRGDLTQAIDATERAVHLAPATARHHFLLGQLLIRARQYRAALASFQAAARLRPLDPEKLNAVAWLRAGRERADLARPQEALTLARCAWALSWHRNPSYLDTLAVAHLSAGHPRRAIALFEQAMAQAARQGKSKLASGIRRRLQQARGSPLSR